MTNTTTALARWAADHGARPGQIVRADCFGWPIDIVARLTNGLGLNYRVRADGSLDRVLSA